jgi:hypothetical protein
MAKVGIAVNIPPVNAQMAIDSNAQGAEAPHHAPYELVNREQIVEATNALTEVTSLQQILHWIGFTSILTIVIRIV